MSGFAQVSAPEKPFLICKGRITHISDAKLKEKFSDEDVEFVSQSFRIEGSGASENIFYNFEYRPEWFQPGFTSESIGGSPAEEKRQRKAYQTQIQKLEGGKYHPTALLAAVGFDQDVFGQLATDLLGIEAPASSPGDPANGIEEVPGYFTQEYYNLVTDVLRQYCIGNDFGYELKQGVTPGGTDENGKIEWQKADKYKVAGFFELTEKNLKNKRQRAEKAEPGTVKFLIDEQPF